MLHYSIVYYITDGVQAGGHGRQLHALHREPAVQGVITIVITIILTITTMIVIVIVVIVVCAPCPRRASGSSRRPATRPRPAPWRCRQAPAYVLTSYGRFSKFHVCFCGLDSGNLKFETVRTNKQHICF